MDNAPAPKKYIRTLEGDMEAVKKGITPNLAPLKAPPVVPVPVATPVKIPEPRPSLKATEGTAPKPSPIETYSGDFLQRMKDTHASTATVLAAEQDASTSGVPQDPPRKSPKSNIIYIIAGIILVLLGIAGSYIAYTSYLTKVEPIILTPTVSAPIFVDDKEKISGTTPKDLLLAIKQSMTRPLAPNTVRFLYTDFATTTDNSIFSLLQLPAPGALLRNMNASRSMAGIISAGGGSASGGNEQNVFFILSVTSYGDTFAGMLSWEKTMVRDLDALFPQYSSATSTVATSTTILISSFRDEVVVNHDTRVYYDAEDRSILLYGYWNQATLVIARDRTAFTEIIGRLATTRTQ
ncbi:MAG: hypothetical protein Q8P17_00495 [bacterium]|nr:hypothetical protein [bacterium]